MNESAVLDRAARARIVLLGEVHDDADHHRWQLRVLSAVRDRSSALVIGVEMLPRQAQPILDRWVAGTLGEAEFLEAVRWKETWGHDPALYLPVFRFARDHRIAMLALNVERDLVAEVARGGWEAIPPAERRGVGDPAPPAPDYRRFLAAVFAQHEGSPSPKKADDVRVRRFIDAQMVWDRAMAESIAAASAAHPRATIVGIVGRGHVEHGWGIPHQLAALGVAQPLVLLPVEESEACAAAADLADALYVLQDEAGGLR